MEASTACVTTCCRVGLQLEPNDKGLGVLGVVEADFLTPTHNKQDFDDTPTYRSSPLLPFAIALVTLTRDALSGPSPKQRYSLRIVLW